MHRFDLPKSFRIRSSCLIFEELGSLRSLVLLLMPSFVTSCSHGGGDEGPCSIPLYLTFPAPEELGILTMVSRISRPGVCASTVASDPTLATASELSRATDDAHAEICLRISTRVCPLGPPIVPLTVSSVEGRSLGSKPIFSNPGLKTGEPVGLVPV